jgi:phosphatidylserine/phosphatidylglycerophosphate/cardiolipin synthase-like enzyme
MSRKIEPRRYNEPMHTLTRLLGIFSLILLLGCDPGGGQRGRNGTATPAASEDGISIYFSPGTDCGQLIIDKVRMAQKHVYVQAYSFTSDRIAKALVEVHKRGVDVKVILDDDKADKKSELDFLSRKGIDTYLDSKHEKAHSKVILIDGQTIITGSFNFSDRDEEKKADNLVVIEGKAKLIDAYEANFRAHLGHSKKSN